MTDLNKIKTFEAQEATIMKKVKKLNKTYKPYFQDRNKAKMDEYMTKSLKYADDVKKIQKKLYAEYRKN